MPLRRTLARNLALAAIFASCATVEILPARSLDLTQDRIIAEQFCGMTGFAKPSRQTVIVVDQSTIATNPPGGLSTQNKAWISSLEALIDPVSAQRRGTFLPRERLTIYLAPADGSAPQIIFAGCMPFFSTAELRRIATEEAAPTRLYEYLFSTDLASQASLYADTFLKRKLALTLAHLDSGQRHANPRDSTLLLSLAQDKRFINADYGIPRVILFGSLAEDALTSATNDADARSRGFALGKKIPIELRGAEVYVVDLNSGVGGSPNHRGYQAYFLASHGVLLGWSKLAVDNLALNPLTVRFFGGKVHYCDEEYYMGMRIVADDHGNLVNSWVADRVSEFVATPLNGTLFCDNSGVCSLSTGNNGFANIWSPDWNEGRSANESPFGADLPFAGFRELEAKVRNHSVDGRVWDEVGTLKCAAKTGFTFHLGEVGHDVF